MTSVTMAGLFTPNGELGFNASPAESLFILALLFAPAILIFTIVMVFLRRRRAPQEITARTLKVHTANLSPDTDEIIVIITVDEDTFNKLLLIDGPCRLTSPTTRPVTFQTGVRGGAPTLDPNTGWTIPVTAATKAELHALPAEPGEYELATVNVAIVVE